MEARSTITPKQAFVAGPDDLKKIVKLLSERIGTVIIDVESIHDIARQFTDVKTLCDDENPWSKRIVDVRISARSDDWKKHATVRLSERRSCPIDAEINASETVVTRLRQDLLDIISGMRPWYSRIARIDFVLGALLILSAVSFFMMGLMAFGWIKYPESTAKEIYVREMRGMVLVALACAVGWAINKVRQWLFPVGLITIGQVRLRHAFLEKVRWTVVVGFLVSLAASVAVLSF